ncbi:MAG TPA: FHA domain-containing protein [Candidatus Aminicenantes bacterium]|jgi:FHA domain.|nr:FHA domain-containing protein [Acidobacteriota bacterium]HNQ80992.1 FHA domain-containing protein [Candidatus Aminicenantes bacterium]MDD8030237.1 FHA domain-containing protein [Acidobacteriota bacterium]MDD8039992.1 FHA domain-containing protein [Acidobacteriota bacterium]MDW3227214.1 FHA domain-containing protein [Acidobacteriota bacterium]
MEHHRRAASCLAHIMADMTAPFHMMGMPGAEAKKILDPGGTGKVTGKTLIDEDIAGPGGFRIRDLDSTNGTYVRGERVSEAALCAGDEIMAGATRIGLGE